MKIRVKRSPCICSDGGRGRVCPDDLIIVTDDLEAAKNDQGYLRSLWFVLDRHAVAQIHERPFLVKALVVEGYELEEDKIQARQPKKPDRRSGDRRATRRRTDDKRKAKLRAR